MTIKQLLAGIGCKILYKLQFATSGKSGGFRLYHLLWQAYTSNYQIQRTGYLRADIRAQERI